MSKIYTRRGDDGSTGLFGGPRVRKDSLRVAAYGDIDELKLVSAGRGPGTQLGAQQARVYYKRGPVTGEGDSRKVDYHLDIRPQGGGALKREAHLELHRQPDGSWRVNRFNETQPH